MSIIRFFCIASLLSLAGLAAHGTTVVVERDVPPAVSVAGAAFEADRDLHNAWVVVDFVEHDGGDEGEQVYSERLAVPGLTYDAATRTIHLQDGDRSMTCAVTKRLLWATYFSPTSECPIRVQQSPPEAKAYGVAQSEKARFLVEVGSAR